MVYASLGHAVPLEAVFGWLNGDNTGACPGWR
jgi:hypothetical protein